MKKIETKTGKLFSVLWCGESTVDNRLRFCITGADITSVFNTFSNSTDAEEIKYYINETGAGEYKTFVGFIDFQGVNTDSKGIVVTLAKGE